MNVVQNKKKSGRSLKPTYKQNLNFEIQDQVNPTRIINRAVNNDALGNTTTTSASTSRSDSQVILAITEGRGHAQGEVGIAAIDTNSPVLVLCQISDNFHFSDTLNKIHILNPTKILLPDTIFECRPMSSLIRLIKEAFSHVTLVPLQRRHFNEKLGSEQIENLCSRRSKNILQIIAKKYYCLSSAAALLTFIKDVSCITFGKNCLKVEYQTKHGGMMIDLSTAARLELLYSLSNEPSAIKKFSLFATLNKCETRIGQRHLRANILEPSYSIDFISRRQDQIKVLMEKEELLVTLREHLQNFRGVDQLLKISCVVPAAEHAKAIETNIQMALLLKRCLEDVKPLCELVVSTTSGAFEDIRQLLSVAMFDEILEKLDQVLQPDIHKNRLAQKHFQHLYAVKGGVNGTIDFLRQMYSETTDRMRDYVVDLTEQSQLPIKLIHSTKLGHHLYVKNPNDLAIPEDFEVIHKKVNNVYMTTSQLMALNDTTAMIANDVIILSNGIVADLLISFAKEIDTIHFLIGAIIDLDIVQSLTETSKRENYCCPKFDRITRLEAAFHPMLENTRNATETVVIKNNVIATANYNFYLISGPNMSGKTIYIKMIAIIQIMAQIGCFVPAKDARIRMTDKIFSRLGFQDNIEQGASSFTVELREMDYIYSNLTCNSLLIMDELCRSTNPLEGEAICWKFCDKLLQCIGFSDDNYFKDLSENPEQERSKSSEESLKKDPKQFKMRDVARPFIYLTTHFTSLHKLPEKFNNALNLHMHVQQRTVDDKLRLEFKYKVQSGATPITNYGIALARTMRFPTSLLDRAEEIAAKIPDETFNHNITTSSHNQQGGGDESLMNSSAVSRVSDEMATLEKDVLDLYSRVLLLMSTSATERVPWVSIELINFKLKALIEKMTPAMRELVEKSSLEEIITVLNATRAQSINKTL